MAATNCTSSGFTSSFFQIIQTFIGHIIGSIIADFQSVSTWTGNEITFLFVSWGNSFSKYGIFIPAIFVITVILSILGIYIVFIMVDAGKDVVGD